MVMYMHNHLEKILIRNLNQTESISCLTGLDQWLPLPFDCAWVYTKAPGSVPDWERGLISSSFGALMGKNVQADKGKLSHSKGLFNKATLTTRKGATKQKIIWKEKKSVTFCIVVKIWYAGILSQCFLLLIHMKKGSQSCKIITQQLSY